MAARGGAGGEGLRLAGEFVVALEEDRAAALVLVQQGGVLEVGDELILPLQLIQRSAFISLVLVQPGVGSI